MRFYMRKCNEENARYVVSVYGWNIEDKFYFEKLGDAEELFNSVKLGKHDGVTILGLYDLVDEVYLIRVEFEED